MWQTGVNFTNVLRAAFTLTDPKSAKKTVKLSSFFALLGVKAGSRMLVKLTPGLQDGLINNQKRRLWSFQMASGFDIF